MHVKLHKIAYKMYNNCLRPGFGMDAPDILTHVNLDRQITLLYTVKTTTGETI